MRLSTENAPPRESPQNVAPAKLRCPFTPTVEDPIQIKGESDKNGYNIMAEQDGEFTLSRPVQILFM